MIRPRPFRAVLLAASALTILTAGAGPALAQDAASIVVPPLQYTHRELPNGLDVYAMPDPTAGTVTVQVWYDVGGKDDPEGRSGFAHLFEHILSRKTVNIPYGQISTWVENAGGSRNASTGQDFTNYYETVPPEYLETMLWTHAERMARPVVDQAVFDAERSIVKEELRQRVYAPPYGRLGVFFIGDNSFDESIYRRSVIGSIEQLDAATIDDARAFHEAYYRPATATLIVSGNFDPAQLDRWVDQYFGDIPNPERPVPVLTRPVETPRVQPRDVVAYAPNVPLPAVGRIWPGVPADHPDAAALDVLQGILSRGQNSRLYQRLVYTDQVATSASFGVNTMEEDGVVSGTVIVAQGKSLEAAETSYDAVIAEIRTNPVTRAELDEAKTEIVASELRQRETASGRAFILGQALVSEGDPGAPDARLAAIQAVTADDVLRVARTYLRDDAVVRVRYLDESQRPEGVPEDSWRNPAPVPTFVSVPPAILPPNELRPEGQRMAPPAPGAARVAAVPAVAERTLPNGLRVIVAKSTDLPIINAQLIIGGGAAGDPEGRMGLASGTAGLAREGAGGRTAPQIAASLESLGASIGAGAGADATVVSLSAPVASLDRAGPIFADVVQRPDFPAPELERQRTRAINGLRVALRDPAALAGAALDRLVYGAAPYGAPASGTAESLAAMTREDVVAHHARWWRPDNAALVITGGMDPEAAFAFAEATFGDWDRPAGAAPQIADRAGEPTPPRVLVIDMPGAGQAAVAVAVRGPDRGADDWAAATVANAVIGGGSGGRLFNEVRAKRGLSYGAYSSLSARADGSVLTATTQTKNESATEVVGLVLAEIDRLGTEPLPDQTVSDRENFVLGGFSRSLETTGGLGGFIGSTVVLGLPLSEIETWPTRLRATDPAAVSAVAGRWLGRERAYVVVVGDASQFLDSMRAAHPDLVVIKAEEVDLNAADLGIE
ncbi:MAG: insulinase family protein [Alphaproteobacteria bacterium]|nr:insulinase family protein [Alphaproteobacteria bacterium]MBU1527121.1 insulinase family protein [Alphaproteobacteria bacterium]MBU2350683.1 insulinase family protein [Alphaproteobacteria bacterium]MBU2383300.1 insulinase family protein [Alphaproteobacteria bacterium]